MIIQLPTNADHGLMSRVLPHLYLGDYEDFNLVRTPAPSTAASNTSANTKADSAHPTAAAAAATDTHASNPHADASSDASYGDAAHESSSTNPFLNVPRITHILSLLPDIPRAHPSISHCLFAIEDSDRTDILSLLPQCIKFIDDAIASGGTVLVHCFAGVSRSASVVIAYVMHLSRKLCALREAQAAGGPAGPADPALQSQVLDVSFVNSRGEVLTAANVFAINGPSDEIAQPLSFEEAFKRVRSVRNIVYPNLGFQNQLRLFSNMGCRIDRTHPSYRWNLIRHILLSGMCSTLWKDAFEEYLRKHTMDDITKEDSPKKVSPVDKDAPKAPSASYLRFLQWSSTASATPAGGSGDTSSDTSSDTSRETKGDSKKQHVHHSAAHHPQPPHATEIITCRRCNKQLCSEKNMLPHPINIFNKKSMGFIDRDLELVQKHETATKQCSIAFIEPMRWMHHQLLRTTKQEMDTFKSVKNYGWYKLHCPECFTKVGLFSFDAYVHCPECRFPASFGVALLPNRVDRKFSHHGHHGHTRLLAPEVTAVTPHAALGKEAV